MNTVNQRKPYSGPRPALRRVLAGQPCPASPAEIATLVELANGVGRLQQLAVSLNLSARRDKIQRIESHLSANWRDLNLATMTELMEIPSKDIAASALFTVKCAARTLDRECAAFTAPIFKRIITLVTAHVAALRAREHAEAIADGIPPTDSDQVLAWSASIEEIRSYVEGFSAIGSAISMLRYLAAAFADHPEAAAFRAACAPHAPAAAPEPVQPEPDPAPVAVGDDVSAAVADRAAPDKEPIPARRHARHP